jgi:hypothetical protein
MLKLYKPIGSVIFLFLLSGCAIQFVDSAGRQRIIGLVDIATASATDQCQVQSVEVKTIGLSGIRLPSHGGLTLGYSQNTTTFVSGNNVVTEATEQQPQGH